ncbi:MAG: SMP-30/gluconolactonase/LRE family protein [Thaumarchaeota archaeon]|nr:SMP-30/gluconolactonase/LRE family protein [Nitrososphaerota archaeon]
MIPEIASNIRAELGEGPSWDAEKKVLYWVDISGGVVYVHTPNDPNDKLVQRVKDVGCVVPRKGGGLAVASQHALYGLDLQGKTLTPLTEQVETDKAENRFNDGKCDPAGRFWAGTMDGRPTRSPIGAFYVLEKGRKLKKVLSDITVSNGMGWSPDNKTMYYIDSPTRKVSAFDYALSTGEIKNRRTVVDFAQTQQQGNPDGMAVDAEGMIWVAHWGGGRVTRWNPSNGKLLDTIIIPADQSSSCCFGGDNLDELYITSARKGIDPKLLAAKPLTGALFVVKTGVRGLPTNAFDG